MTCKVCLNFSEVADEMSNLGYCRLKEKLVPDFEACPDLEEVIMKSLNEFGRSIKIGGAKEVRSDGRVRKLLGRGDVP